MSRRAGDLSGLVLDPFVGSGTTVLAAEEVGVPAVGLEAHPFVRRVAQAKLLWPSDAVLFVDSAEALVAVASEIWEKLETVDCAPTLQKVYSEET